MAEEIQTGHRVFGRDRRIGLEVIADKPFVIEQPGGSRKNEPTGKAEQAAPTASTEVDQAAEDIAARIAGDRQQKQADILELARTKPGTDDQ